MNDIFFDTETTGFDVKTHDRIIEVALIEYSPDGTPTGRSFHSYVNPEGKKVGDSYEVHGISDEFLSDKPTFKEILPDLIDFIKNGNLKAHNANFDKDAMENEFKRAGSEVTFSETIGSLQDTFIMSKKLNKQKGFKHSLDNLMILYGVDSSRRVKHGAYIDTEMLAEVYYKMTKTVKTKNFEQLAVQERSPIVYLTEATSVLSVSVSDEEKQLNSAYLEKLPKPKPAQNSSSGPNPTIKV